MQLENRPFVELPRCGVEGSVNMFRGLKKVIVGIVIFTLVFAGLVPIGRTVNAATYSGYIMAYFKQATGEYGLNLCYSTDGLNWKNINDGKPVLYAQLGTKGIRDPIYTGNRTENL
jgi:hypothetical protein